MQQIHSGYRGVALLVYMNADRLLWVGTISTALVIAAYLGAG
ncbi:MAG: hypothetical protein ACWA47_13425 [Brevirhabdus sp.]